MCVIEMVELRKPSTSTLIKLIATLVGLGVIGFVVYKALKGLGIL